MNLLDLSQSGFREARRVLYIYLGDFQRIQVYVDFLARIFSESRIGLVRREYDFLKDMPGNVEAWTLDTALPFSDDRAALLTDILDNRPWDVVFLQGRGDSFLGDPEGLLRWFERLTPLRHTTKFVYLNQALHAEPLNPLMDFWAGPVELPQAGLTLDCPGVTSGPKLDALIAAAGQMPAQGAVEIGRYYGRSTLALAHGLARHDRGTLVSVDPVLQNGVTDRLVQAGLGDRVKLWTMRSRAAHDQWNDLFPEDSPGLVFIDGDHAYPEVSTDLRLWSRRLAPGGLLAVDDYGETFVPVLSAVNEQVIWSGEFEDIQFVEDLIIARKK